MGDAPVALFNQVHGGDVAALVVVDADGVGLEGVDIAVDQDDGGIGAVQGGGQSGALCGGDENDAQVIVGIGHFDLAFLQVRVVVAVADHGQQPQGQQPVADALDDLGEEGVADVAAEDQHILGLFAYIAGKPGQRLEAQALHGCLNFRQGLGGDVGVLGEGPGNRGPGHPGLFRNCFLVNHSDFS